MMDAPKVKSCKELTVYAVRVRCMRQRTVNVKLGIHVVEGGWTTFTTIC